MAYLARRTSRTHHRSGEEYIYLIRTRDGSNVVVATKDRLRIQRSTDVHHGKVHFSIPVIDSKLAMNEILLRNDHFKCELVGFEFKGDIDDMINHVEAVCDKHRRSPETKTAVWSHLYIDPFGEDFYLFDGDRNKVKYSELNSKAYHYRGQRSEEWDDLVHKYISAVVDAVDEVWNGDRLMSSVEYDLVTKPHLTTPIVYEYITYVINTAKWSTRDGDYSPEAFNDERARSELSNDEYNNMIECFDVNLKPKLRNSSRCFEIEGHTHHYYVDDDEVWSSIVDTINYSTAVSDLIEGPHRLDSDVNVRLLRERGVDGIDINRAISNDDDD